MDTPLDFTTPSEPLNQALQASFNLGAGQVLDNPRADLIEPVKALLIATGRPFSEPAAGADLRQWVTGYPALDGALSAADMMGTGHGNTDVAIWFGDSVDTILADLGLEA